MTCIDCFFGEKEKGRQASLITGLLRFDYLAVSMHASKTITPRALDLGGRKCSMGGAAESVAH